MNSGRWDVDDLVNNGNLEQKLFGLLILWRGKRNDIHDWRQKDRYKEAETLEKCSQELQEVIELLFPKDSANDRPTD